MSDALNKSKFLSPEEYQILQATINKFAESNPRDTALLAASMHTGARPSEVLAITAKDLDVSTASVFIKGLKGSRDREIPLPMNVFARLSRIARGLNPDDRVFPLALRTYQGIWHQYRPVKKGVKALRHTFAMRLYEKTKDVRLVQMALGHRYLNTTQIYVDYVYNQTELQKLLL